MRFAEANTAFFPRVKKKKKRNDSSKISNVLLYYYYYYYYIVIVRAARFIPTMIQRVSILARRVVQCPMRA